MLIVVEGLDNTGKTTLVQRLAEDHKLLVMNNRKKPASTLEMMVYLDTVRMVSDRHPVMLDRLCTISEPIYGRLRPQGAVISQALLARHLELLAELKPLIIYCRPPTGVILNFGDRPQMEGVIENATQLLNQYDRSLEQLAKDGFHVVHWDYTNYNYSWIHDQVSNYLEKK